jgi:hypothetical protein
MSLRAQGKFTAAREEYLREIALSPQYKEMAERELAQIQGEQQQAIH